MRTVTTRESFSRTLFSVKGVRSFLVFSTIMIATYSFQTCDAADKAGSRTAVIEGLLRYLPQNVQVVGYFDVNRLRRSAAFGNSDLLSFEAFVSDVLLRGLPKPLPIIKQGDSRVDAVVFGAGFDGERLDPDQFYAVVHGRLREVLVRPLVLSGQYLDEKAIEGRKIDGKLLISVRVDQLHWPDVVAFKLCNLASNTKSFRSEWLHFGIVSDEIVLISPNREPIVKILRTGQQRTLNEDLGIFVRDVVPKYCFAFKAFSGVFLKAPLPDYDWSKIEGITFGVSVDRLISYEFLFHSKTVRDAVEGERNLRRVTTTGQKLFASILGKSARLFHELYGTGEIIRKGRLLAARATVSPYLINALFSDYFSCDYLDGDGKSVSDRSEAKWIVIHGARKWDGCTLGFEAYLNKLGLYRKT